MNSAIIVSDSAIPLIHCSIALHQGALLDPTGKEGATRLLLRLMRRSAGGLRAEEIDERIDRLGGSLGIDVNRSVAGFHAGMLARTKDEFLDLIESVITEPDFDEDEFRRLKKEALAEWVESLDDDSSIARRNFSRELFSGHPYSRLAGGSPASIERIELNDLKQLYPKLFGREQLEFAFSGDIDDSLGQRFADRIRSKLPTQARLQDGIDHPLLEEGRRLVFVDKPERTQTQIIIGGSGTHPADEDHTALFVGHTIFGGTFSARLSREVRGKRGWSYGAYSNLPFDRKRQSFSLWTFPQADDAGACIKLELELLGDLIDKGVTSSELNAAKKYLKNSHAFSIDTASKRASQALDTRLYALRADYFDAHLDRVNRLTADDVNSALQARLSAENLLITVVGTSGDILDKVEGCIPGLKSTTLKEFDSRD